jgi:uncharacterized membrane protein YfcA
MPLIALVFAALIGLALGTLGGGGSVLTVPVLVYVVGYDPKVVPTSLGVVGAASLMGAVRHWRAGRVDVRIATAFGALTMGASFAGARLALHIAGGLQMVLLAIVTLIAAVLMLRPQRPAGPSATTPREARSESDGVVGLMEHLRRLAPVGLGVGLLTGLIGVGGGFLIVPALVLWGGVSMPTAVGTSLIVITLNCVTGLLGYAGHVAIPWGSTGLFTAVAVIGSAAGAALVGGVPPHRLRQIFAIFLLFVGGFVLYRNRALFHRATPHTDSRPGTSAAAPHPGDSAAPPQPPSR